MNIRKMLKIIIKSLYLNKEGIFIKLKMRLGIVILINNANFIMMNLKNMVLT